MLAELKTNEGEKIRGEFEYFADSFKRQLRVKFNRKEELLSLKQLKLCNISFDQPCYRQRPCLGYNNVDYYLLVARMVVFNISFISPRALSRKNTLKESI